MPEAHDIGKLFWHRIRLRLDSPRHHRHATQEYEYPYRSANSPVLRLFRHLGVVVGWWRGGELDEESAEYEGHLSAALQSHEHTSNADSYHPIADIKYTLVERPGKRSKMAEVNDA